MDDILTLSRRADGRTLWQLCDMVETSHLGLEIRPLPGKGLGVIVTRSASFARGERILCEEPLIAWCSSPDPSGTVDWKSLESQVEAKNLAHAFYSLCDKFSDSGNGVAKTARGIWNSNSFPMEDVMADGLAAATDGVHRSAVYRLCSRINHSCRPNCFAAWNALLGRQTLHALREIGQGEELTVAYVGGAEAGVRARRRQMLAERYHFGCACEACSLTGDALALSERRQSRIHDIHARLPSAPADLVQLVDELVALSRQEGIPLIWAKAGLIFAVVRLKQAGDDAAAAERAAIGAACARLTLGEDSSVYRKLAGLATTAPPLGGAVPTRTVGAQE